MIRFLPILLLTVSVAACGASRQASDRSGNRSTLTEQELRSMDEMSAYDAIARARPEFLRSRGSRSLSAGGSEYAVVYLDNTRMGGLDTLHSIRTATIREIRFLSGPDATTRYGTGHGGGVILIITR